MPYPELYHPSFVKPEEVDGGRRGPNLLCIPSVSLSPPPPRKQSGKLKLNRTRKSLKLISRAGPVVFYFFAHRPGQRFSMSQILFQQLVPLQVKCRDCEERWGSRYPVPVGGGWGRAKGKDGGPRQCAAACGRVSSRSPREETYLGPGSLSLSKFSVAEKGRVWGMGRWPASN